MVHKVMIGYKPTGTAERKVVHSRIIG